MPHHKEHLVPASKIPFVRAYCVYRSATLDHGPKIDFRPLKGSRKCGLDGCVWCAIFTFDFFCFQVEIKFHKSLSNEESQKILIEMAKFDRHKEVEAIFQIRST